MHMIDERIANQDGPPTAVPLPTAEPWPPPFVTFRKIPRLNREIIVTEKIDGTNAVVVVPADSALPLAVGSRNRWITPGKGTDNYDFARFVDDHEAAIRRLGPGTHHGEWWGVGIARKYNIQERRWSLFNTSVWTEEELRARDLPANVHVVPTLERGTWEQVARYDLVERLRVHGSVAAPGYMNPEGFVIYHVAAGAYFKWTFGGDGVVTKTPSPVEHPEG